MEVKSTTARTRIEAYIREHGETSSVELRDRLGYARATVYRALCDLQLAGVLTVRNVSQLLWADVLERSYRAGSRVGKSA